MGEITWTTISFVSKLISNWSWRWSSVAFIIDCTSLRSGHHGLCLVISTPTRAYSGLVASWQPLALPQPTILFVSWSASGLDTLESRREELTKRFFKCSVLTETSCLHYLLPDKRDVSVTGRLHYAWSFGPLGLKSRTFKFRNSFIPYCLDRYV